MFNVVKIQGGYAVADWNGEYLIAYKSKKHAEQYATGSTYSVFNYAENMNNRIDNIRTYLKARKIRAYKPVAQLEMF